MRLPDRVSSKRFVLIAVLCLASFYVNASDKLIVYTVNYPLQYFAERIAGAHAEVHFPAPADVDPAFWKPDRKTVREYQKADLILLNGAGYAKWSDKVALPRLRQVNTSASFVGAYIQAESTLTHGHGPGGDHSHAGTAFTTWLDFYQASAQAEAIMQALARKRPQYQAEFARNYAALKQELMALDLDMQRLAAKHPGKPLFVSHPVYHYFARRYELRLESVTWEPDVMPTDQEWERLVFAQETFPATWMLWEGQPRADIVERLRSAGISAVVFQPCANRPPQGEFMDVMKQNVERLKRVFGGA